MLHLTAIILSLFAAPPAPIFDRPPPPILPAASPSDTSAKSPVIPRLSAGDAAGLIRPVGLYFWTVSGCAPCVTMRRALEPLRQWYTVQEVDAESELGQQLAKAFSISTAPTLILYVNGKAVGGRAGIANTEDIDKWIGDQINRPAREKIKQGFWTAGTCGMLCSSHGSQYVEQWVEQPASAAWGSWQQPQYSVPARGG